MRLFVTAVVLACAPSVIAQTKAVDTPVQQPMGVPQASIQKQGFTRAPQPGTVPANLKTENVPPSTPVVTLKGVCKDRQAKSACETVVTREELERFVKATAPEVSEAARGRMAVQYARTLAFSALAEQQGLEKNPVLAKEIEMQLKLLRMRILASAYLQNLQRQTTAVLEPEIQKYYSQHQDQYEQAQVRRLAVPISVPTQDGHPLDHAAVKSELAELRSRALAGEDLNQLQQDAYKHLHIQATPPPVNSMTLRRSNLQGDDAKVFDLKSGEMTAVLDLPAAFAFLKLESKEPVPIQSVRGEIEAALRRDRIQNEVSKLNKKISAQFNLQYLEMPSQPDIFGPTALNPPTTSRGRRRPTPRPRP